MKLTKLRLLGFKSFVEPTDFLIEPGLTGVVGPNGCGKSTMRALPSASMLVSLATAFPACAKGPIRQPNGRGPSKLRQRCSLTVKA